MTMQHSAADRTILRRDVFTAGVKGALVALVAVNMAAPLYHHGVKIAGDFSFAAMLGLLALPGQLFLAFLSALLMLLWGGITAMPALTGGYYVAREMRRRAIKRRLLWMTAGAGLGLANFLLLYLCTGIGHDGTADMVRAAALYGAGGIFAAHYLQDGERDDRYYNR